MIIELNSQEELSSYKDCLVKFTAIWCSGCRQLDRHLQEFTEESGVDVIKVDIEEFPELASQHGVMSIPATFVVKNGEFGTKLTGVHDKNTLLKTYQGE